MKVLIVRFSAIGDCVMAAWAVSAIRKSGHATEIFWAAQSECVPVLDSDHLVDEVLSLPRSDWKRERWSPRTWREQLKAMRHFRRQSIDLGFDFQGHSKTALFLKLSKCKRSYSSRATDAFAQVICPPVPASSLRKHEVERAYDVVGHAMELPPLALPVMPKVGYQPLGGQSPLVTINTGAGEADKVYSTDNWRQVASALLGAGCRVTTIGGPRDSVLGADGVTDLVGKTSLRESMGIVAGSNLHLSADTGTGHIASAYGVPTVTVFSKNDPERFQPYGGLGTALRNGQSANNVAPEMVVEAAMARLRP